MRTTAYITIVCAVAIAGIRAAEPVIATAPSTDPFADIDYASLATISPSKSCGLAAKLNETQARVRANNGARAFELIAGVFHLLPEGVTAFKPVAKYVRGAFVQAIESVELREHQGASAELTAELNAYSNERLWDIVEGDSSFYVQINAVLHRSVVGLEPVLRKMAAVLTEQCVPNLEAI